MKKIGLLGLCAALLMTLTACGTNVDPGYAGVKVKRTGSDAGVQAKPLGVGYYWLGWKEDIYQYPTFTTTHTWARSTEVNEEFRFQDKGGVTSTADVAISFSAQYDKTPLLYQKWRMSMEELISGQLRNIVRDALVTEASAYNIDEIYGPKKAELIAKVKARVDSQTRPYGLIVENVFWASDIRVPEVIGRQINAKIANEQAALAAQAAVATATANANAKIEEAKGEAEANRLKAESIRSSPELIQLEAVRRWKGDVPQYVGAGSPVPFLNIR